MSRTRSWLAVVIVGSAIFMLPAAGAWADVLPAVPHVPVPSVPAVPSAPHVSVPSVPAAPPVSVPTAPAAAVHAAPSAPAASAPVPSRSSSAPRASATPGGSSPPPTASAAGAPSTAGAAPSSGSPGSAPSPTGAAAGRGQHGAAPTLQTEVQGLRGCLAGLPSSLALVLELSSGVGVAHSEGPSQVAAALHVPVGQLPGLERRGLAQLQAADQNSGCAGGEPAASISPAVAALDDPVAFLVGSPPTVATSAGASAVKAFHILHRAGAATQSGGSGGSAAAKGAGAPATLGPLPQPGGKGSVLPFLLILLAGLGAVGWYVWRELAGRRHVDGRPAGIGALWARLRDRR